MLCQQSVRNAYSEQKAEGGTAHAGSGGHTMGNDADLRPTDAAERDRDKGNDDAQSQVDPGQRAPAS